MVSRSGLRLWSRVSFVLFTAGCALVGTSHAGGFPAGASHPGDRRTDLDQFPGGRLQEDGLSLPVELMHRFEGAPAPVGMETENRDAEGRVTLRAFPLSTPLEVDGVLDDAVYEKVIPADGFVQQEPDEGAPASERTRVWVLFDADSLYIAADLEEREQGGARATEMRRDHREIGWNDSFSVILDTFHDRRNGFLFQTNELGGLSDGQVTDERNTNNDWNTVWWSRGARSDRGWTVEIRIPFRSLRYAGGGPQIWGINFRRMIKHKNERVFLTPMSQAYNRNALQRLSEAATLVGLVAPPGSRRMEFKPYAIGSRSDRPVDDVYGEWSGDVGADFKVGITEGITADLTWNTDFAQVEDDESQVNLSRFSLFFPEKREFFLEGQGVFDFGGRQTRWRGGGGGSDVPIPFFSRRIGIADGVAVPILGGARLHGRAGDYTMGLVNMQTRAHQSAGAESTNFTAVRVKRDVFARSNIGIIATHRNVNIDGGGANSLYGADGNFAPTEHLRVGAYYMETRDALEAPGSDTSSYRGQVRYTTDLIRFGAERLHLGGDFNPEMGFVRRRAFDKNAAEFTLAPRIRASRRIRQLEFQLQGEDFRRPDGEMETRELALDTTTIFESGDRLMMDYTRTTEDLLEGFDLGDEVRVPAGRYQFSRASARVWLGTHRKVNGFLSYETGGFFGGTRRQASYGGRVTASSQIALEPNLSLNWVDVPDGELTTALARLRATYTISPRAFVSALGQYNSADSLTSLNVRLRWEYEPGSDLFVVFSTARDGHDGYTTIRDRTLVVKMTRLMRF